MLSSTQQLIHFLQEELAIPTESIDVILQQCEQIPQRLPVVLWQQRLIGLGQVDRLLLWLENYILSTP